MRSAKILNADQHKERRIFRSTLLKSAGYAVTEAAGAEEVVRQAQTCKPDLILLDMPDLDSKVRTRLTKFAGAVLSLPTAASDKPELILSTISSVLRLREMEAKLASAKADLKKAESEAQAALSRSNDLLAQFAFGASHDLKEPLRTVTTYAQLLERKHADQMGPEAARYVRDIVTAAERMRALIEDLVAFSHAQSGNDLPLQPALLDDVVNLALNDLRTGIQESGAVVTHGALPHVMADIVQLARAFQNLIANSIKYRKAEQAPRIHISAEESGEMWVIRVSDNGIGFDPKYKEQVFQPFKRLHGRDVPGSGLGLAITQTIIKRHGGSIWAESEPGRGTDFYFTLLPV